MTDSSVDFSKSIAPFDGIHEVRNQIVAALELHVDLLERIDRFDS